MLSSITSAISAVWKWLVETFTEVWRQFGVTLGAVWTIVLAVVSGTFFFIDTLAAMVGEALNAIAEIAIPTVSVTAPSAAVQFLNLANTLFPVNELIVFTVANFSLLVVMTIYEKIKSWIPTVSGA